MLKRGVPCVAHPRARIKSEAVLGSKRAVINNKGVFSILLGTVQGRICLGVKFAKGLAVPGKNNHSQACGQMMALAAK